MNKLTETTVHCDRHGDKTEAFVCKHLLEHSGVGFFSAPEEPEGWCSRCEQVRINGGESGVFTDDYARANFNLVCGECYKEIRALNVVDGLGSAVQ